MFEDVHSRISRRLERHRTPGADFDEVTYADDATCLPTESNTISLSIKGREEGGFRYGSKLNNRKCKIITTDTNSNIHFRGNIKVPKARLAIHLGCNIGIKTSKSEELSKIFAICTITMRN